MPFARLPVVTLEKATTRGQGWKNSAEIHVHTINRHPYAE